jgi:hypothetical protein
MYHGLMQILGFGGCVAVGFLLTSLPSFLNAATAALWELALALLLAAGVGVALVAGEIRLALYLFAAQVAHLDVFTLRRLKAGSDAPPVTYIVWGLVHATVGPALVLFPISGFPRLGERMLEQGFLLALIMGIGSFLGARLMGTFQPPAFLFRQVPGAPPVPPPVRMKRWFAVGGLLLFLSFWIESGLAPWAGKLLRAATVTAQLCIFGRIYRLPMQRFLTTRLLWTSLWLLVAGLWLSVPSVRYEIAALHVSFIGGFGLCMLVMGLRVVASHGGLSGMWERAGAYLWIMAAGAALAIAFRTLANFWPARYSGLLAAGAACWCVALAVWAGTVLPKVTPKHTPRFEV